MIPSSFSLTMVLTKETHPAKGRPDVLQPVEYCRFQQRRWVVPGAICGAYPFVNEKLCIPSSSQILKRFVFCPSLSVSSARNLRAFGSANICTVLSPGTSRSFRQGLVLPFIQREKRCSQGKISLLSSSSSPRRSVVCFYLRSRGWSCPFLCLCGQPTRTNADKKLFGNRCGIHNLKLGAFCCCMRAHGGRKPS